MSHKKFKNIVISNCDFSQGFRCFLSALDRILVFHRIARTRVQSGHSTSPLPVRRLHSSCGRNCSHQTENLYKSEVKLKTKNDVKQKSSLAHKDSQERNWVQEFIHSFLYRSRFLPISVFVSGLVWNYFSSFFVELLISFYYCET